MKLDLVAKLLFALAAIAGACFYGYDVMTRNAAPVYANAGLSGKEGFTVVSHTDGKGGNYLIVNTYAPNPDVKSEMRRVMIVYEIKGDGEGKAEKGAGGESALAKFCTDFTGRAREGKLDPVFGRDPEIRQMVDILARRRKNTPP